MGISPGLESLPHARGGVSNSRSIHLIHVRSSPRPWGCFHRVNIEKEEELVFPTPVGVFLRALSDVHVHLRLPHARGGVSSQAGQVDMALVSSPRPWGCFFDSVTPWAQLEVFPTPVGVFLAVD